MVNQFGVRDGLEEVQNRDFGSCMDGRKVVRRRKGRGCLKVEGRS